MKAMRRLWFVTIGVVAACAQGEEPSDQRLYAPVGLPQGVREYVGIAQPDSGELFLATEKDVFIKSPFGDSNGWEKIVPPKIIGGRVSAIIATAGNSGSRVLVCFSSGTGQSNLWAVTWELSADLPVWQKFRYRFSWTLVGSTADEDCRLLARGHNGAGRAIAYLTGRTVFPVQTNPSGSLELGSPVQGLPETSGWRLQAGASGSSVIWPSGSARLWSLSANGSTGQSIDFENLWPLSEDRLDPVRLQQYIYDPSRNFFFALTNHGLAIGEINPATGHPKGAPQKVQTVGVGRPLLIGFVCGRLFFVSSTKGKPASVQWETWRGRRPRTVDEFLMSISWESDGDGPADLLHARQLAGDLVIAEDARGCAWQWVPGRWESCPEAATVFRYALVGNSDPGSKPTLVCAPQDGQLWRLLPPSAGNWQVQRRPVSSAVDLVPDSGGGGWLLSGITPLRPDRLEFVTPHGGGRHQLALPNQPGSLHSSRIRFACLDGTLILPTSRHGGLLLPLGECFVHAQCGHCQHLKINLELEEELESLVPAGNSYYGGWLGLLRVPGKPLELVFIDIPDEVLDVSGTALAEITLTEITRSSDHLSILLPDSDGYIWLAHEEDGEWLGQRVLPTGMGRIKRFGALGGKNAGQTPRYLLLPQSDNPFLPHDYLLFTERGCVRLPQTVAEVREKEGGRIGVFPGFAEEDTPGDWTTLFSNHEQSGIEVEALEIRRTRGWLRIGPDEFGWCLLTNDRRTGLRGPGYHFQLSGLGEGFKPLAGPNGSGFLPQNLLGWTPDAITGPPERIIWGNRDASMLASVSYAVGHKVRPGQFYSETIPDLAEARIAIPLLGDAAASEGWDQPEIAVVGRDAVAFYTLPAPLSWGRWPTAFYPSRIRLEHMPLFDGKPSSEEVIEVAATALPNQLRGTVRRAVLEVAPAYDRWWVEVPDGMRFRKRADDVPVPVPPNGQIGIEINPGSNYAWTLEIPELPPGGYTQLTPWEFDVAPAPVPPPHPPVVTYIVAGLTVIATMFGWLLWAVPAVYRWFLIWHGRRWALVASACPSEVAVRLVDGKIELQIRHRYDSTPSPPSVMLSHERLSAWAGGKNNAKGRQHALLDARDSSEIAHIRQQIGKYHAAAQQDGTVLVDVQENLFSLPWAWLLGELWGQEETKLIAGQVTPNVVPPGGEVLPLALRPPMERQIVVGLVVNDNPTSELRNIRFAQWEALAVRKHCRNVRAKLIGSSCASNATVEALQQCLTEADVVHVIAHAEPEWIDLQHEHFTADHLKGLEVRTRLLIISGCKVGDPFRDVDVPLITELVSRGVNVVAATTEVDDIPCRWFFEQFYQSFFPVQKSKGQSLADSVKDAVAACRRTAAKRAVDGINMRDWQASIDPFTLYGNPSVRLVLAKPVTIQGATNAARV